MSASKGSNQTAKTLEEDAKNYNLRIGLGLNIPYMDLDTILTHVRPVHSRTYQIHKSNLFSFCEEGGRIKFVGANKRLTNGEELDTPVTLAVAKAMKMNKNPKAKYTDASDSKNDSEHLNFEN